MVWSPFNQSDISTPHSVERMIFRLVGLKMGFAYRDVPNKDDAAMLELNYLQRRRSVYDLYKVLNGRLN